MKRINNAMEETEFVMRGIYLNYKSGVISKAPQYPVAASVYLLARFICNWFYCTNPMIW